MPLGASSAIRRPGPQGPIPRAAGSGRTIGMTASSSIPHQKLTACSGPAVRQAQRKMSANREAVWGRPNAITALVFKASGRFTAIPNFLVIRHHVAD
jgi:hypothetical protein